MSLESRCISGFGCWRASLDGAEALFVGKGPRLARDIALRRILPEGIVSSWLEQVHSADVLEAQSGLNGPGDALVTTRSELALAVVTADCVPVLLAGGGGIAAVHAGWRGLAGSIVPAAVGRLECEPEAMEAVIGPAIGPCCYEVGPDVADRVRAASSDDVVHGGRRERPHLDLVAAAREQLVRSGVDRIRAINVCTRCDERLWSYRRDGPGAGRNLAAIWMNRR